MLTANVQCYASGVMSAREALIREILKQPEPLLRELRNYLAFLVERGQHGPNGAPPQPGPPVIPRDPRAPLRRTRSTARHNSPSRSARIGDGLPPRYQRLDFQSQRDCVFHRSALD